MRSSDPAEDISAAPARRIAAIDLARGGALVAMAIYHFAWDLEFFGYSDPGTTAAGGWKLFARCIASSFLFLVGVSLYLAHGRGVRWRGFGRRLAMVAGAALAISLVTYVVVPGGFIFFGILHQIALASLIGLAFLRLPGPVVLAAAAATVAAPYVLRSDLFSHWSLWWVGLAPVAPRSNDYVPVFPWFGAVLAGIGVAKIAEAAGLFERLARWRPGRWSRLLQAGGRHSLAVYLIHQPVLIGLLFLATQVAPPARETPHVVFRQDCEAQCEALRDVEFCTRYCGCMLDRIEEDGRLDQLFSRPQAADNAYLQGLAEACMGLTEGESRP